MRRPALLSCALFLAQSACTVKHEPEAANQPEDSYDLESYSTEDDDTDDANGSLSLRVAELDEHGQDLKVRVQVQSLCGEEGVSFGHHEIGSAMYCDEDGVCSMYLHKEQGHEHDHKHHKHHKHRHDDDHGHVSHDDHRDAPFCDGPQFVDVYKASEILGPIEIPGLLPGQAEVTVTLHTPFGPSLEGSAIVDIVAGETSPAQIHLKRIDIGGLVIDVSPPVEPEPYPIEEQEPREPRQDLAWERFALNVDASVTTSCVTDTFVAYSEAYDLWVGASTCDENRYKLLLGETKDGTFYEISDYSGNGQDHCELVNPSFTIPDDDDIASGCADCATSGARNVEGTPTFARAYVGEDFELNTDPADDRNDMTVDWYECGMPIK